jgi:RNA polymerase sigma-70 factor (ECF subfamily)
VKAFADGVRNTAKEEWSDGDLLELSKRGDEEAFVLLYRRHQGPVFRFALHMSGRQDTAEEVTQEVFLTLLSEPKLYVEERGALQGYLIGAARNQVRRQLARNRMFVERGFEDHRTSGAELLDGVSKEQELEALRTAILSLPANYREVVVLCELQNVDYAKAAQQLGCAVGTVRSRLHRARALLGAKLRKGQGCPV